MEPGQSSSGSKLGGATILIGALNEVLVVYVVSTPASSRYDTGEFFRNFARNG
jgi:hypothetical protein